MKDFLSFEPLNNNKSIVYYNHDKIIEKTEIWVDDDDGSKLVRFETLDDFLPILYKFPFEYLKENFDRIIIKSEELQELFVMAFLNEGIYEQTRSYKL